MGRKPRHRGGASAWQQMVNTVGDGWTQAKNSLMSLAGQNTITAHSTSSVPKGNVNAQNPMPKTFKVGTNSPPGASPNTLKGGRRKRHRRHKTKKHRRH